MLAKKKLQETDTEELNNVVNAINIYYRIRIHSQIFSRQSSLI